MSKEAMKLALEALEKADSRDGYLTYITEIEALREALAEQPAQQDIPDLIAGALGVSRGTAYDMMREALAAQQEPLTDIYRSFEQWKNGNVLEHGVPRTEYYSEAQLDLVEMGWKYGYDAGRAEQPAQQEPVALWTEAQHERAYRNSPELHNDVKSLAAFKRVAKEIAAMYGITKGNT